MKIAIYTAMYGNRDICLENHPDIPNADFFVFTDSIENKNLANWIVRIEPVQEFFLRYPEKERGIRQAKWFKISPVEMFKNYDYTIWIDANIRFKPDFNIEKLIGELKGNNIATFRHPISRSIFDELSLYLKYPKADNESKETIFEQILEFIKSGYDCSNNSVPATGVIISKISPDILPFYFLWWNTIILGSHQDQLSFSYAADYTNTKISWITGEVWEGNGKFFDDYHWDGNEYFSVGTHSNP